MPGSVRTAPAGRAPFRFTSFGDLAAARADRSVDWIIVQVHQDSCSSSATGNGSDLGIRGEWLPLFDAYQVDLVLCGHDHDYERSFPVRGYDSMAGHDVVTGAPVQTCRPHPVTTTAADRFDTSTGTVHLILGGGGTSAPLDEYGVDTADGLRQAKVFTRPNRPAPGAAAGTRVSRAARPRSPSRTTTRPAQTRRTRTPGRPGRRNRTTQPLKRSRSPGRVRTAGTRAGGCAAAGPRPPGQPVTLGKPGLSTAGPVGPGGRRRPIGSDAGKQAHRWVQTSAQS